MSLIGQPRQFYGHFADARSPPFIASTIVPFSAIDTHISQHIIPRRNATRRAGQPVFYYQLRAVTFSAQSPNYGRPILAAIYA